MQWLNTIDNKGSKEEDAMMILEILKHEKIIEDKWNRRIIVRNDYNIYIQNLRKMWK